MGNGTGQEIEGSGGGPAVIFLRQNDHTSTHAGSFVTFGFAHENGFFTDFKLGVFDVDLGVGYGLTRASDRVVVKAILGYAFPVPAESSSGNRQTSAGLINPMAHPSARTFQP